MLRNVAQCKDISPTTVNASGIGLDVIRLLNICGSGWNHSAVPCRQQAFGGQ